MHHDFHAVFYFIFMLFIYLLSLSNRKLHKIIEDDAETYNEECGDDINLSDDEMDVPGVDEEDEYHGNAENQVASFAARLRNGQCQ